MNCTNVLLGVGLILAATAASMSLGEKTKAQAQSPARGDDPKMVLVPSGTFIMGKEHQPEEMIGRYVDNPAHKISLDSFYLDKTAVTNAEYFRFCQATGHRLPFFWGMREFRSSLDFPDHPIAGVSYQDAEEYAAWRGVRLPTEAEWEYAARGGLAGKEFPNGDTLELKDADFAPQGHGPERVGSYAANGYGIYDMAGNVGEWVADYYDRDYYTNGPVKNPQGPAIGRFRVIRGGGWFSGKSCNQVHYRNALPANWVDFNVGFRCAKSTNRE